MPGVFGVNVNLALETGRVTYDPTPLSIEEIIGKIEKVGYGASVKGGDTATEEDPRKTEIRKKTRMFVISAALSLPLL